MGINLKKGERISLTKDKAGLSEVVIGLGWNTNRFTTGGDFDLDVSVFLVGENGKVNNQNDFVFYGNLTHSSGAVKHIGDNRTGEGEGDDEQIYIDLKKIPSNVSKIIFSTTIYEAEERKQNFGQVDKSYIRIIDQSNNQEICRYDLEEDFSVETAVILGELYNHNNEWKFNAIGSGFQGGLGTLCKTYGIDVD